MGCHEKRGLKVGQNRIVKNLADHTKDLEL